VQGEEDGAGARLRAEAIVRGAIAAGATDAELEAWTWPLLADHFLDFGHALIYQAKLGELVAAVGERDRLWGAHVYGICNGTREDRLPHWASWRQAVEGLDAAAWWARRGTGALPVAALEQPPRAALAAVLASTAPVEAILSSLSEAAARRLLHFDLAVDAALELQDDWLDLTHRLTVVDALRSALRRWPDPRGLHILLQVVRFVAAALPYDGPAEPVDAQPGGEAALRAALSERDRPRALGVAAGMLAEGRVAPLRALLLAHAHGDHATRGIVVAHQVKTALAAFREREATGRDTPVLAVVRWFASPPRERRVGRRLHAARQLVEQGRPPARRVD
jgi:hypothetical protein